MRDSPVGLGEAVVAVHSGFGDEVRLELLERSVGEEAAGLIDRVQQTWVERAGIFGRTHEGVKEVVEIHVEVTVRTIGKEETDAMRK